MRTAKARVESQVEVQLLSAQYREDRSKIPDYLTKTKELSRSVLDLNHFRQKKKLPLIADILDRLYQESTAEYLIYTNVDIGLYPNFYLTVIELIKKGYDALIINRRRIPTQYSKPKDLQKIYKERGRPHPGFDCFVFHRNLYPKFQLASICIGVPFIGIAMAHNIFALAKNYRLIKDEQLTFHLGMEIYAKRAPSEYYRYNRKQFWLAMRALGPHLNAQKLPFSDFLLPVRLIKWGLHPNFPLRLMLLLEWKNLVSRREHSPLGKTNGMDNR